MFVIKYVYSIIFLEQLAHPQTIHSDSKTETFYKFWVSVMLKNKKIIEGILIFHHGSQNFLRKLNFILFSCIC